MRSVIVPGAVFPDYELTDHTAKRRKLSELQGQHPMVLVLGRGGYCPKDRRQAEGLVQGIASSRSAIADLLQSARTTSLRRTNIAPASGRTGLSFPTCGARSRKIAHTGEYDIDGGQQLVS
jgi:hypothetical protein